MGKILTYFKASMALVYVVSGVYLLFNGALVSMSNTMRIAFGIALILYGGFRVYQTFIGQPRGHD